MAKNITKVPNGPLIKKTGKFKGSTLKVGGAIKKAQVGDTIKKNSVRMTSTKNYDTKETTYPGGATETVTKFNPRGGVKFDIPSIKKKKAKAGAMIKRADGSFSKPGLWDNIRKNKGSGKKPTKQMLVQEKKIKAKTKK